MAPQQPGQQRLGGSKTRREMCSVCASPGAPSDTTGGALLAAGSSSALRHDSSSCVCNTGFILFYLRLGILDGAYLALSLCSC